MLSHGKKILFWDELPPDSIAPLLDALGVDLRDRQYGQPKDHVHRDIPRADREELATALAAGEILMGYMGWADCRICGVRLGTRDFFGHGFVWPEKAEHYVLVHHVWTPECYELLAALRRQKRTT
jgi:hypothetical protein